MPRFLIDVPHEANQLACTRVVQVFLTNGSHFLANADWGCKDGVHHAWMVVEVDSKAEARAIVPPAFQAEATVVELNKFSTTDADGIVQRHTASRTGRRKDAGA